MARKKDTFFVKVKKRLIKRFFKKKKKKKVEKSSEIPKKRVIAYDKEKKSLKFKEIISKLKQSKDLMALSNFFGYVLVYGMILNGSLILFGIKFNIPFIFACGLLVYFVENKFVPIFRALVRK